MSNESMRAFFHDVESPLSGIRALSSMLASGDYGVLSDDAKKAVTSIQDAAERAIALVEKERGLTIENA